RRLYRFTDVLSVISCISVAVVKSLQTSARRIPMSPITDQRDDYITIIAPTAHEAMAQLKARGLADQGYAIAGRIGRHRFTLVGGEDAQELFSGAGMIAATFCRRAAV